MTDVLTTANSLPMYLLAGGIIAFVLLQAFIFLIRAWKQGKKLGMPSKQLRKVAISSATFTLLPSVAILVGVLSLAPSLGIPLPWTRLSVVGSLQYEAPAANNIAKSLLGTELPTDQMTAPVFASIAFGMTMGVISTSVFIFFFYKSYQKKITKTATKDTKFTDVIFCSGFMGMVAAYVGDAVSKLRVLTLADGSARPKNILYLIAMLVSAGLMAVLSLIIKKKKLDWLENYSFAISMLGGMVASVVGQYIFPSLSVFTD